MAEIEDETSELVRQHFLVNLFTDLFTGQVPPGGGYHEAVWA
jgi:hypothetical protein